MTSESHPPRVAAVLQSPSVRHGRPARNTPISQRRPLQRINANAVVLSPTKRRKQSHTKDQVAALVKPLARREAAERPVFTRWSSDEHEAGSLLLEVFSRLNSREFIENAAPVCKVWRKVAHSKELWAMMRPRTRLIDQLLQTEKVVERRSKGRLFRCKQLGSGEEVLLRMVDLQLTNAGKDDGVPTSFLREAALLKKLQHPNVIRHFGSEILGKQAVMCTEFVYESFSQWFKRLEPKGAPEKAQDIKVKFRQLLQGLSHVHHQGVMHRNLKPDNIFLDQEGVVKLGDFTTTRMLDLPLQAYTPEDPKERDRSGREMRRLWYRAPELILRDEIYGPKVDSWSVGCLLAEAASGRALFQSDSEIDHLFRVFRLVGTPTVETWPDIVGMKNFSPKFPVYTGLNMAQVTRAALGDCPEGWALMEQAGADREDILRNLQQAAKVLKAEGMMALDHLVAMPPARRAGADAILASPFFGEDATQGSLASRDTMRDEADCEPRGDDMDTWFEVQRWYRGVECNGSVSSPFLPERPSGLKAECPPPVSIPSALMSSHMVWNILQSKKQNQRNFESLPPLPLGFTASQRMVLMDFVIGLATALSLTDYTLHLAAQVVDSYLAQHEEAVTPERVQVIGATCLKIADVFAEQSKEYYKQENAVEYAEASLHAATSEQILLCEKDVLPKLQFDLHLPNTHWFVQCYLAYGRFAPTGDVAKIASFIGDLTLLDYELLRYAPSLRAQCAMVLAAYLVQQAKQVRWKPDKQAPVSTLPASTGAAGARSHAAGALATSVPTGAAASQEAWPLEAGGRRFAPAAGSRAAAARAFSTAAGAGSQTAGASGGDLSMAAVEAQNAPSGADAVPQEQLPASMGMDYGSSAASAMISNLEYRVQYLEHWDKHVRDQVCAANLVIDAEMCLQAIVRTLTVLRRECKNLKLNNVEAKHVGSVRIVYPERFPVEKLVRHLVGGGRKEEVVAAPADRSPELEPLKSESARAGTYAMSLLHSPIVPASCSPV